MAPMARMAPMTRDDDPWGGAVMDYLMRRASRLSPITTEETSEQRADFAYGQLACMRRYRSATPAALEQLRRMCRIAAGCEALPLTTPPPESRVQRRRLAST